MHPTTDASFYCATWTPKDRKITLFPMLFSGEHRDPSITLAQVMGEDEKIEAISYSKSRCHLETTCDLETSLHKAIGDHRRFLSAFFYVIRFSKKNVEQVVVLSRLRSFLQPPPPRLPAPIPEAVKKLARVHGI